MADMDVCIIGGGAAGMMCAVMAARKGLSVVVAEKNEKLGKKLYITGKGRCNFTNACDFDTLQANVITNPKFLYGAFHDLSPEACISFFEELGLRSKTERGGRVFPVSDRSSDVIKALEREMRRLGVEIRLNTAVKELLVKESDTGRICEGVITKDGGIISSSSTVIATGGLSYPATGSDGDGFAFARQAGVEVTDLRPGLVPLNVKESFAKEMQGLSLKNVQVGFYKEPGGKALFKSFGEMLFTHFGVSGPVILSASSVLGDEIRKNEILLEIDFKPALTAEQLDKRLIRELNDGGKKSFKNILKNLLPSSAVPVFAGLVTGDPDKPCSEVGKKERTALRKLLKGFRLTVTGLRGFEEAVITRGGVSVKELDPKTMGSKKVGGLYFAGEVIDADALTGGFNLQIAWSTAARCAKSLATALR